MYRRNLKGRLVKGPSQPICHCAIIYFSVPVCFFLMFFVLVVFFYIDGEFPNIQKLSGPRV